MSKDTGSLLETFRASQDCARIGWRTSYANGGLYRVENVEEANRAMGHTMMKGRLLEGDLLLCIGHTGDAFHDFMLLEPIGNGYRADRGMVFGAYGGIGKHVGEISPEKSIELIESEFVPYGPGAPKLDLPPVVSKLGLDGIE
jgi:hypothetical protein